MHPWRGLYQWIWMQVMRECENRPYMRNAKYNTMNLNQRSEVVTPLCCGDHCWLQGSNMCVFLRSMYVKGEVKKLRVIYGLEMAHTLATVQYMPEFYRSLSGNNARQCPLQWLVFGDTVFLVKNDDIDILETIRVPCHTTSDQNNMH